MRGNGDGDAAGGYEPYSDEVAALLRDFRRGFRGEHRSLHNFHTLAHRALALAEARGGIGAAHYVAIYIPGRLLFACFLIEALGRLWPPIGIALYGMAFLIIPITAYGYLASPLSRVVRKNKATPALVLALQVMRLLVYVTVYGELSRHLYLLFGGYAAHGTGFWHWLRYGVTQALDTSLFGVISAYGWHLSEVQPIAWWSRTLLFLFTLVFVLWVLAAALTTWHSYRQSKRRARRTQQHANEAASGKPQPSPKSLWFWLAGVYVALGYAPLLVMLDAIVRDHELRPVEAVVATLAYSAVVGGAWLAWRSIRLRRAAPASRTPTLRTLLAGIALSVAGIACVVLIHWPRPL